MTPALIARARDLWVQLAGANVEFPAAGDITVVTSANSWMCPPGWAGIVVVGGAGIATAPSDAEADRLRAALSDVPVGEPEQVCAKLEVLDVRGPARLAYADHETFRTVAAAKDAVPVSANEIQGLLAATPEDEAEESGIGEITSNVFVVREGRRVVAASGYRHWSASTAHMCVLVASDRRGRGLARAAAAAAVADALDHGLLAQWRARVAPSVRVAGALGFRDLGAQVSLRLPP